MILKLNVKFNLIIITSTILILDQTTKYIITNNIDNIKFNNLILFSIELVKNYGAAFNILSNNRLFLSLISIISSIIIILVLLKNKRINIIDSYGLSFILGGSIGNGIDRVIYGYVIDFINLNFINFPVFNIADISINIGFLLILYNLLKKKE